MLILQNLSQSKCEASAVPVGQPSVEKWPLPTPRRNDSTKCRGGTDYRDEFAKSRYKVPARVSAASEDVVYIYSSGGTENNMGRATSPLLLLPEAPFSATTMPSASPSSRSLAPTRFYRMASYLNEQTPWMFGRDRRREDLLKNLKGVLETVWPLLLL